MRARRDRPPAPASEIPLTTPNVHILSPAVVRRRSRVSVLNDDDYLDEHLVAPGDERSALFRRDGLALDVALNFGDERRTLPVRFRGSAGNLDFRPIEPVRHRARRLRRRRLD